MMAWHGTKRAGVVPWTRRWVLLLCAAMFCGCALNPRPARGVLIGGAPFGEAIIIWWNFVARTADEIREARDDWRAGRRFGKVAAYKGKRLEAPPFTVRPVASR